MTDTNGKSGPTKIDAQQVGSLFITKGNLQEVRVIKTSLCL